MKHWWQFEISKFSCPTQLIFTGGTTLVVQWLGNHAPNAGAQIWSLARELVPHAATKGSHATTKSSHATTKDPTCYNKDLRSHVLTQCSQVNLKNIFLRIYWGLPHASFSSSAFCSPFPPMTELWGQVQIQAMLPLARYGKLELQVKWKVTTA